MQEGSNFCGWWKCTKHARNQLNSERRVRILTSVHLLHTSSCPLGRFEKGAHAEQGPCCPSHMHSYHCPMCPAGHRTSSTPAESPLPARDISISLAMLPCLVSDSESDLSSRLHTKLSFWCWVRYQYTDIHIIAIRLEMSSVADRDRKITVGRELLKCCDEILKRGRVCCLVRYTGDFKLLKPNGDLRLIKPKRLTPVAK